ncbi:MAG: pilus assembly protein [Eubacterium sp.]|nr:pilus assembly protein [Eubacterium sp.]
MNNKGIASVEAAIVIPIFLFAFLAIYHIINIISLKTIIFEAATETSEYLAERTYLEEVGIEALSEKIGDYDIDTGLISGVAAASVVFPGYLDDRKMVDKYVVGGVSGITFYGSYRDEEDNIILHLKYKIQIPFISIEKQFEIRIKQRAYVGRRIDEVEANNDDDIYVYVTDNMEAYHISRSCSHLNLSIEYATLEMAKESGYKKCSFCGNKEGDMVYITKEGDCYHKNIGCSGLTRNVHRVRLSEVGGVLPCQRCGQ